MNEVYKTQEGSMRICSPHPGLHAYLILSCHHIAHTGMYQQHHHWANSSCYCVDGAGDAILSSRPDTLLANGGAFLPSPSSPLLPLPPTPPSSYMPHHYSQQHVPSIVPPPPMASQLHAITHLSSPTTSSGGIGAASATSSSTATFRRALSTGDLIIPDRPDREEEQRGAAAAATRYTAEERRERIDKYRSKRNQRNFQKKITYACRKTLADSRPRVKGRFARNGGDYYTEADAAADHHFPAAAAHQSESESESPAATAAAPEWWPPVHEEGAGINLAELCADDDDEVLAAYLGVSSISIADHHYSCQP